MHRVDTVKQIEFFGKKATLSRSSPILCYKGFGSPKNKGSFPENKAKLLTT